MNMTRLAVLAIALVAGVGSFFLMMSKGGDEPGPISIVEPLREKTVRVLVAEADIERGQRVTEDKLKWVSWPEKALTENYITEARESAIEDFSGAVARSLIVSGEPIIETKLVKAGSAGMMAAVLAPGMRAVTMSVSPETGSGGFILPGDRVDIMYSESNDDEVTITRTILNNVKVLAVDTLYSENSEVVHTMSNNLTLELSPADAEYFTRARSSKGELSLALRSVFEPKEEIASGRRNTDVEVIRYGRS